jgi:hypothetical protein
VDGQRNGELHTKREIIELTEHASSNRLVNSGWSIIRAFCGKPGRNTKRKYDNAQNCINGNMTVFREAETQAETKSVNGKSRVLGGFSAEENKSSLVTHPKKEILLMSGRCFMPLLYPRKEHKFVDHIIVI